MTAFVSRRNEKKETRSKRYTRPRETHRSIVHLSRYEFIHVLDAFWNDALELVVP